MKKAYICVAVLLVAATVASAAIEMTISRVEENGRLLVPVRGVFEATGATVEWVPASQGVHISGGGTDLWMWVNSATAQRNGVNVGLDVPPRNVGGRVHIPLRFVGESLGRGVNYTGNAVYLTAPGAQDIILYIQSVNPPPRPPTSREILPQSNDRSLTSGDLAGMSNWRLTLARNEIYARHGRPFNNANIRAYFNNTGWYSPNASYRDSWLSQLEERNAVFIREYQQSVFGTPATRP